MLLNHLGILPIFEINFIPKNDHEADIVARWVTQERNRQQAGNLPLSRAPPFGLYMGKFEFTDSITGIELLCWQVGYCLLSNGQRESGG